MAQSSTATDSDAETIGRPVPYSTELVLEGDRSLEDVVKGASSLWMDRDKPASGVGGLLAKARADYRRILLALYGEARYGGAISITLNGREVEQLRTGDPISEPVSVVITVDPGPIFVFGETRIVNEAPPAPDLSDEVPPPASAGFVPGATARSGVIVKAETLAIEAWRQQGYPKARIADRQVTARHDRNLLEVALTVDPGAKAFYGPTIVSGTRALDPDYIAWMTDLPAGREYDPDDIEKANRRLTRLGVFRALRIEEAERIEPSGALPIGVFVQERKPRNIALGATFDTIDGLGVEARWLHRNLFGRAEQLRFDIRIGGIADTIDPEKFDYRFATTFVRPGVITPDTNQISTFIAEREVLEAYTRSGIYAETGLEHRVSDTLSWRVAPNGGYGHYDDDVFGARSFSHLGIYGEVTHDSRDSEYDPASGYYVNLFLDPYYEFNYGNGVARGTVEGRTYLSLDPGNRTVLAGRGKFGSLAGSAIPETAPDKLFFAGGGGSVRGYAYRNIGVPVAGGEIVGGRSLVEGSVELRSRVTDTIGLAAFADAGYVDADTIPDFSGDFRVGVGAGLRYFTGFAPIRLDIAFPLDPDDGDPGVALYIGLGQAF